MATCYKTRARQLCDNDIGDVMAKTTVQHKNLLYTSPLLGSRGSMLGSQGVPERTIFFGVLVFLALISVTGTYAHAQDARFNEVFEEGMPRLEEISERQTLHTTLPRSAWFSEDQDDNSARMNELRDELITTLGITGLNKYRAAISELRGKIKSSRERIADYNEKRVTAPEGSFMGMHDIPFRVTRTGYERRVEAQLEAIEGYKQGIVSIRNEFAVALRDVGLSISGEQLDVLLASVIGDDMIDMAVVFHNAKLITLQLEDLTQNTGEDPETARRYYGVFTVLLDVLNHMQQSFVADVDQRYLPLAQRYMSQASSNIAQAQTAIEQGRGAREILENNIISNQLTYDTAELYQQMLIEQREYVMGINEELQEDILTAENTYRTVELSSNVAALLETGVSEFEALIGLKAPELRMFENEQMRGEFEKLTDRMQREVTVSRPTG